MVVVPCGLILHEDKKRVLMTLRRTDVKRPSMWEYPGGKLEEGESLEQALQRELREELGVHVGECQYLASIGMYFEVPALVLLFLCRKIEGSPQPHAAQSLAWVDPTEAIANMPMVPSCYLFYPHVLRAIAEETIDI